MFWILKYPYSLMLISRSKVSNTFDARESHMLVPVVGTFRSKRAETIVGGREISSRAA